MKKLILILMILPFIGFSQENERRLLHMWELSIKNNEGSKFQEGMKKWKECYIENQGADSWNVWNRIQGEGNVVVVTMYMDNWAAMDSDDDAAGQSCSSIFETDVFPYVESIQHNIAGTIPDWSRAPENGNELVWVTFFKIKNSTDFSDVVKAVTTDYRDDSGQPFGYWYGFAGGSPEAPDYMVSRGFKNFAALDIEEDGPWEVMEKKHGKDKASQMRNKFRNSLDDSWSYLYRLNQDLSRGNN